jgi:hypothetical protein
MYFMHYAQDLVAYHVIRDNKPTILTRLLREIHHIIYKSYILIRKVA